jgi:hypothetical protein
MGKKEKKLSEDAKAAMDMAAAVLGDMYAPAKEGPDAIEFIDRFQIMPLLSEKLGDDVMYINLPDLMSGQGYMAQRICGRPYWMAVPVV